MKLEQTLFELNTLVDYGTYYLSKASENKLDTDTAFQYLRDHCSTYDLIDGMDIDSDDIMCNLSTSDVVDYVRYNFDPEEIYDEVDLLNGMSKDRILRNIGDEDIKEYVRDNFDVYDMVDISWE